MDNSPEETSVIGFPYTNDVKSKLLVCIKYPCIYIYSLIYFYYISIGNDAFVT